MIFNNAKASTQFLQNHATSINTVPAIHTIAMVI